jgi:hypothetical protein
LISHRLRASILMFHWPMKAPVKKGALTGKVN